MDTPYVIWPTSPWGVLERPGARPVQSLDAFSFGEPARGVHAFHQEWAPALDLFDIDRPDEAPPIPLALAKLVGLVMCLTAFSGLLLGAVGRVVVGAFSGTLDL